MSTAGDHEEILDFEPAEEEVKETKDMAKEVGLHVKLLHLSEEETPSMELEAEANSTPGPLGAVALQVAPTQELTQDADLIVPQLSASELLELVGENWRLDQASCGAIRG